MLILFVAIGCALGGIARHLGIKIISRILGERFPWGTLGVNALGSFLLGVFLAANVHSEATAFSTSGAEAFLAMGFCGGLTTFSTFSLQTFNLVTQKDWSRALGNILGSVLICTICVVSGFALGELWAQ